MEKKCWKGEVPNPIYEANPTNTFYRIKEKDKNISFLKKKNVD